MGGGQGSGSGHLSKFYGVSVLCIRDLGLQYAIIPYHFTSGRTHACMWPFWWIYAREGERGGREREREREERGGRGKRERRGEGEERERGRGGEREERERERREEKGEWEERGREREERILLRTNLKYANRKIRISLFLYYISIFTLSHIYNA